ncbi:MAG: hypothetical protein J0G35_15400 [Acidobacteriales bacterium]|nr:hypothetical protein [Terriglobales bacterium]
MWLNLTKLSRRENRFEAWVAQRHQERVFTGGETVAGPCPDDAFLKSLARKSRRIQLSDPRVDHAVNCSICMRRLLELRREDHLQRRRLVLTVSVASCLLVAVVFVVLSRRRGTQEQVAGVTAISQTLDLWNTGTFRGEQSGQLQVVLLPAALVKAKIILPRYSEPGRYDVAVTRDKEGRDLLAHGNGVAIGTGDRKEVSVYLDLRRSQPGSYFLSTTHEQDQASYYYPLQIR